VGRAALLQQRIQTRSLFGLRDRVRSRLCLCSDFAIDYLNVIFVHAYKATHNFLITKLAIALDRAPRSGQNSKSRE
jgi:hypothetical protein